MSEIKETIGFVGGGEMAFAIASGMISGERVKPPQMFVSNPSANKLDRFKKLGLQTTHNNMEIMEKCQIVFLCIKPQVYPVVVNEIHTKEFVGTRNCQLVISIIAGINGSVIERNFPWARVIRTMPNTPCLVKAGIFLYCRSSTCTDEDLRKVDALLSSSAECILLPERLIDAGQAISGCGPAYFFTAMDALADGGVKMGLPRATALRLAAQTMVGAGKMHLETKLHPGVLKDSVTSPGGVTICALHSLDKGGFRAALIDAVETATNKSLEIGRSNK